MRGSRDWQPFASTLGCIRLLLLVELDPIGVFGYERALDEYDSYAEGIYDLLVSDAGEEEIAQHLHQIATVIMGVRGRHERDSHVARRLIGIYRIAAAQDEGSADV